MIAIEDSEGAESLRPETRIYTNRLSDWFSACTRWVTKNLGEQETLWTPLGKEQESANVASIEVRKFHQNRQDFDNEAEKAQLVAKSSSMYSSLSFQYALPY